MSEIRFYHMEQSTLDQALPTIALKAYQSGKNVLIKTPDAKEAKRIDALLWGFSETSFLPHGVDGDKNAPKQPVFITSKDKNPNAAEILILTHGCVWESIDDFSLCCEMLDGRIETQISDARARWKTYKNGNHDLTYWRQDENGKWHKK